MAKQNPFSTRITQDVLNEAKILARAKRLKSRQAIFKIALAEGREMEAEKIHEIVMDRKRINVSLLINKEEQNFLLDLSKKTGHPASEIARSMIQRYVTSNQETIRKYKNSPRRNIKKVAPRNMLRALEIAEQLKSGKSQTQIAKEFGVTRALVSLINLGKVWGDVTGLGG